VIGFWEPVLHYFFLFLRLWQVTKFITCHFKSTFAYSYLMWKDLFKTSMSPVLDDVDVLLAWAVIPLRSKEMWLLAFHRLLMGFQTVVLQFDFRLLPLQDVSIFSPSGNSSVA